MTDRPMIFGVPMIQSLRARRKTQTRRVIVPPAPFDIGDDIAVQLATGEIRPQWAVGDRLWVKENWRTSVGIDRVRPSKMEMAGGGYGWPIWYEADGGAVTWRGSTEGGPGFVTPGKLRPSIFLPRWASRLTLLVTDVRAERLNDIGEADAVAEGIYERSAVGDDPYADEWTWQPTGWRYPTPQSAYRALWETIHGPEAWAANPWVAAITFTVHRANIDALTAARAA